MTKLYLKRPVRLMPLGLFLRVYYECKSVGGKIKLARVEKDMNQEQLAEAIGAKQKSISRYETKASMPTVATLVKIAEVLGIKNRMTK